MRSLDDALPAAKAARASVSAVKNRPGEAEGGAAFRKTFADLGHARDTNAKTHAPASHTPASQAKAQPDEPAQITTTGPSMPATQASKAGAAEPRVSSASVPTSTETEGKSDQTPHTAAAHNARALTGPQSRVSSEALDGKTDTLALLSLVTAAQRPDADSETSALLSPSADEPIESHTALPKTTLAAADSEHIEGTSVSTGNAEKAPAVTTAATRSSAAATLSATLALKSIKADPEASDAGTAADAATLSADAKSKSSADKRLNTVEIPSKLIWKTKENTGAPLANRDLETQVSAEARPRTNTPERTAQAVLVEKATKIEEAADTGPAPAGTEPGLTEADLTSRAPLSAAVTREPASLPVTDPRGSVLTQPPRINVLTPERATPPQLQAVFTEEVSAPTPHVAASSLPRQTKQVTTETTPEPAEEAAAAAPAAPAAEMDIRSLMAILGPVTAQPAVDASTKGESNESEARMPGFKVTGDKASMPMATMAAAESSTLPTSADGSDQVFRFARADGKVSPVSLRADADRPVSTASNDQANTKAETVTVLDARRYLGIAPTLGNQLPMTANAQAVAAAITGNGDPTQGLQANTGIAGSQGATGKVVNTLKIQMHPIDLGLVTATLRLRDDELQIDLRVQTGDAYRQLTNDQDAMIKALRAQGFQVDQVNVIFTPSDSAGGNDGSGQPQSNQQQPSQNGRDSQGGLAAGNGGEGRNGGSGQRSADDGRTRQDRLRETPAAPQPGLSDELYF
ncbi:flagellar hook-length control protein FliK [Rhizobium sp. PP-F2F-G20b]|nr:flagellar hook-length control protein FliK [Rhizobium sp. PP-F2F-G20b]